MKKIFLLIILCLILFLCFNQIHRYNIYNGNIIICINNEIEDTVYVEIYLDDRKILSNLLTNGYIHNYKFYPIKVNFGNHKLKFKINNKEYFTKFFSLPIKWIYIGILNDNNNYDIKIKKYYNPIKVL